MNKFVEAGEKGEGPKYGITLVKPSGEQLQVGGGWGYGEDGGVGVW